MRSEKGRQPTHDIDMEQKAETRECETRKKVR
jgi:hypothetical protein